MRGSISKALHNQNHPNGNGRRSDRGRAHGSPDPMARYAAQEAFKKALAGS